MALRSPFTPICASGTPELDENRCKPAIAMPAASTPLCGPERQRTFGNIETGVGSGKPALTIMTEADERFRPTSTGSLLNQIHTGANPDVESWSALQIDMPGSLSRKASRSEQYLRAVPFQRRRRRMSPDLA